MASESEPQADLVFVSPEEWEKKPKGFHIRSAEGHGLPQPAFVKSAEELEKLWADLLLQVQDRVQAPAPAPGMDLR